MHLKTNFILAVFLCLGTVQGYGQANKAKIDSLKKQLYAKNSIGKAKSLIVLSDELSSSNPENSLLYANEALRVSQELKNDSLISVSYNSIALNYETRSKLDSALFYHRKALDIRLKTKDQIGIADSHNNIGICLDQQGKFDEALDNYFKALKIYEKKKDSEKVAMTFVNIGIVYKAQKEYEKSLEYYKKANVIYARNNSEFGFAATSGNIGSVLIDFKKFDESIKYSELAKEGYKKLGYDRYVAYPISNIAIAYDSLKEYGKAEEFYLQAINLHKKFQNDYEIGNISNAYSKSLNKQSKFRESIRISEEALQYIKKAKLFPLEVNALKNLAYAYAGIGNYTKAYELSSLYSKGRDALFEEEKTKAVFELETQYETEKKEREILIQRTQIAESKLKIERKNQMILIFVFLLVLSVLLGWQFFNRQKLKNQQLQKENELKDALLKIETQNRLQEQRLRISRDLHDTIGAQLTFIISSIDNLKYGFQIEDEQLQNRLAGISEFTKETIYELRDTIWAMNRSEITFEDLKSRISNFIDNAKISSYGIDFQFAYGEGSLSKKTFTSVEGMNIYRIIQETVNNSIKHSGANKIVVTIDSDDQNLIIETKDNGKGFDLESQSDGNGLNNMKKRAKEIGGKIKLQSKTGEGTSLKLFLPQKM